MQLVSGLLANTMCPLGMYWHAHSTIHHLAPAFGHSRISLWKELSDVQVILALASGEIIYFELTQTGQLLEVEKKEIAGGVACIDVAPVPEGYQRSRFLAVGSHDSTVSGLHEYVPSISCALHGYVTHRSAHSIRGS